MRPSTRYYTAHSTAFCIYYDNPYLPCLPSPVTIKLQPPQHNSLSIHISTTHRPIILPTSLSSINIPHMHTTNTWHSWQNGTKCRDILKVLWCHSHLVWLVYEGSFSTALVFTQNTFFVIWIHTGLHGVNVLLSNYSYVTVSVGHLFAILPYMCFCYSFYLFQYCILVVAVWMTMHCLLNFIQHSEWDYSLWHSQC